MNANRKNWPDLCIAMNGVLTEESFADDTVKISLTEFLNWAYEGRLPGKLFSFSSVTLTGADFSRLPRRLVFLLALRMMSRGDCIIERTDGSRLKLSISLLLRLMWDGCLAWARKSAFLDVVYEDLKRLRSLTQDENIPLLDVVAAPLILRMDYWSGAAVGGAITHFAGVANALLTHFPSARIVATSLNPLIRDEMGMVVFSPPLQFADFRELPTLELNHRLEYYLADVDEHCRYSFVYQRYSLNSYAGALYAREKNLPFVLEFNGSEIWISRQWGQRLKYEGLSCEIEVAVLLAADLIVVVSDPLRKHLVARGISERRILVNPNGVDAERYAPGSGGEALRMQLGLENLLVIGFIGTFGPWHGAEVLVKAFARLLETLSNEAGSLYLMMIGDGPRLPDIREQVEALGISRRVMFAGVIPQCEGARYLDACDILVAPQIPNPDGSEFFGSPTKLFEYMAMGKAVVASRLGQISQVITDGESGLLVSPGDASDLSGALACLAVNIELRHSLGKAARSEVLAKYTWEHHVTRILERLQIICRSV